jgi:hypothetical protein
VGPRCLSESEWREASRKPEKSLQLTVFRRACTPLNVHLIIFNGGDVSNKNKTSTTMSATSRMLETPTPPFMRLQYNVKDGITSLISSRCALAVGIQS